MGRLACLDSAISLLSCLTRTQQADTRSAFTLSGSGSETAGPISTPWGAIITCHWAYDLLGCVSARLAAVGGSGMGDKLRTAVVIIHGMGEHRPLETLNGFINAGLPPVGGRRQFYSRPDGITDSYESRRYLAPRQPTTGDPEVYAQTEFFEYHWAYMMQGNRFSDLLTTSRRLLFSLPTRVPLGLRILWIVFWALIALALWMFLWGPWSDLEFSAGPLPEVLIETLLGAGVGAIVVAWLISVPLHNWITSSFVDVVRYLDTSPRSYAVRREIRKGLVDLLAGLTVSDRYDRIIIVAHSLGSFIAYDGITYLWGQMNDRFAAPAEDPSRHGQVPDGLMELEQTASLLVDEGGDRQRETTAFRAAQRKLWLGIRSQGNPWIISDLITLGSPMYFADRLYTRNRAAFETRKERWELPTCPPMSEGTEASRYNNIHGTSRWFSFRHKNRHRVLYHGAPFAVVRWTNMWFPPWLGIGGDWFGGPLAPLYGPGIVDVALRGNLWRSRWPGVAHSFYFSFGDDVSPTSVTTHLRAAMGLDSTSWLTAIEGAVSPSRALAAERGQLPLAERWTQTSTGRHSLSFGPAIQMDASSAKSSGRRGGRSPSATRRRSTSARRLRALDADACRLTQRLIVSSCTARR